MDGVKPGISSATLAGNTAEIIRRRKLRSTCTRRGITSGNRDRLVVDAPARNSEFRAGQERHA